LLDVGTGSGVLALAALQFGARAVVAFDIDPLATEAALDNARANGLLRGFDLYCGPLEALREVGFELVVANLLRTELEPLIGGIASRVASGGHAVFAGLLREECAGISLRAETAGLRTVGTRERADANGDVWSALLTVR
jgi:ribosomal protein L11 methyltransferase